MQDAKIKLVSKGGWSTKTKLPIKTLISVFQLRDIVSRIESFPITSPVMKFLTGIELLVQKAQVR